MKRNTKIVAIWLAGLVFLSPISKPAFAFEPFIGQLMLFGGNFCPRNWAKAEGQLIAISSNTALFSIFGTTYGGDGRTTFGLPDLRGRAPMSPGQGPGLSNYSWGQKIGSESQQILVQNMPSHRHSVNATNTLANKGGPGGKRFAASSAVANTPPFFYSTDPANRVMADDTIGFSGSSIPTNITAPRIAINWCVALFGIFPSRN